MWDCLQIPALSVTAIARKYFDFEVMLDCLVWIFIVVRVRSRINYARLNVHNAL
jgi:hypothetical protein